MDLAQRPAPDEAASFYHTYLGHVPDGNIVDTLEAQIADTVELLDGADASHRYATGKWSIAETVAHMIDTERVFAYRVLWFARGDQTPLPGFDQDAFMATLDVSDLGARLDEFWAVRASTLALLRSLDEAAWSRSGIASGHPMTTRAAAWVIAGHERHHAGILRGRYLTP